MSKKGLVKMIAGCLAVVMTAATVMAAPSPTKNGAVSQDFTFTINGEKADQVIIRLSLRLIWKT